MPDALGAVPEPTRATGYVSWANVLSWKDDNPVNLGTWNSYAGGSQGVIKVRLRRQGDEWVDDGTTFRSNNQQMWGPYYVQNDCMKVNWSEWGFAEGRLDAHRNNWIRLDLDLAAGTASFGAAVAGTGPGYGTRETWGYTGTGCPKGPTREIHPVGGGGGPACPKQAGVEGGTMDASRTRIVFSCVKVETGVTENHQESYDWRTRVNGRITLSR
jgi:hypothetical protein